MPEAGKSCSSCEYWLRHPSPKRKGEGECRRHAPQPVGSDVNAKWPRILGDEWCGEYQPRSTQP
jgi:hypothetical protein